jgi:hypothetical protein
LDVQGASVNISSAETVGPPGKLKDIMTATQLLSMAIGIALQTDKNTDQQSDIIQYVLKNNQVISKALSMQW